MNANSINTSSRMSLWLKGAATLLAASALAAFAPSATAQTATGKAYNGTNLICNFSNFTYTASTNELKINCDTQSAPAEPLPGPGTFGLSIPSGVTSTKVNTPLTIRLTRTNGSTGDFQVNYGVAPFGLVGWTLNGASASSSINIANAETFKDVTFNPGSATGRFYVELGAASGPTATTASGSLWIDVVADTTTGGGTPNTPPAGCSTSATYSGNFTVNSQKQTFTLKPGETGAMSFKTNATARITLCSSDTTNTPSDADHEIRIGTCPGDFSNTSAVCGGIVQMTGGSIIAAVGAQPWECSVDANKTYYLNVRHRKLTSPSENSCSNAAGCDVKLQISNYAP